MDRNHLVSTLDVLPTLCDYAGIQPPPSVRGESLRAVIEKPEQPGHEFVVSERAGGQVGPPGGALWCGRSNTNTCSFRTTRTEMFFNLEDDPVR